MRVIVAAACLACAVPASAAEETWPPEGWPPAAEVPAAAPQVLWRCWYEPQRDERGPHVACRLVRASGEPLAEGTVPYYPGIAGRLLAAPGEFQDQVIFIPLRNVPFDMGRVERLAQSVMCGRRPSCQVEFAPSSRS